MMTKVKFMIHRSSKSFLQEKEIFRKIASYYQKIYPDLKFVDKKVKFSIVKDNNSIDFDLGYYHMENKKFTKYDYVISTGAFAVFNPDYLPGDMILPSQAAHININRRHTKITINPKVLKFNNKMPAVLRKMKEYESTINAKDVHDYIYGNFSDLEKYQIQNIDSMRIHNNGKMITCNTIFVPSQLTGAKTYVKGEEVENVQNLQKYLEETADGLNCETQGMIKSTGDKMLMLSWGLDKPYGVTEISDELRSSTQSYHKLIPTFNLAQKTYFNFILLGYLLKNQFKY